MNLQEIAKRPECDGYSGADLAALVREAGIQSVKDFMMKSESGAAADVAISLNNFEQALKKIRPSVSIDVSYMILNLWRFLVSSLVLK